MEGRLGSDAGYSMMARRQSRPMRTGRYCGSHQHLQGKRAILMEAKDASIWLCQFDDQDAVLYGILLAFKWHPFPRKDFDAIRTPEV